MVARAEHLLCHTVLRSLLSHNVLHRFPSCDDPPWSSHTLVPVWKAVGSSEISNLGQGRFCHFGSCEILWNRRGSTSTVNNCKHLCLSTRRLAWRELCICCNFAFYDWFFRNRRVWCGEICIQELRVRKALKCMTCARFGREAFEWYQFGLIFITLTMWGNQNKIWRR